jgi:3-deoxy-manno-octulosonate cytidylyltransferase (CMP-KDO synthetase)
MGHRFRALGVIPARAASSRFPNKVVAPILGKPMIQYVWEAAAQSGLERVVIATDSHEIVRVITQFGGNFELTPPDLPSGTDRVAWVAKDAPEEIIVNIQGDEPLIDPNAIRELVSAFSDPEVEMATLAVEKSMGPEWSDPNIVKVKVASNGFAEKFFRENPAGRQENFLRHIGIYAFRKPVLMRFVELPPSEGEQRYRLEQLRALENGIAIRVILLEKDTIAVDTCRDIEKVERYLLKEKNKPTAPRVSA